MATLINNAGVQHYVNKMVLAENRKVGSKSLPTALADIDNLIDEMKTQFDAEYGSALDMKLNNNENVFSVGTGTNVDRRSEVENSFTDVELSGNSLVNLYIKTVPEAKQGVMTNNNDTYTITRDESSTSTTYLQFELNPSLFKANTTYTVILTGYSTSSTKSDLCFYDRSNAKDICRIKSSALKNNSIGVFNFVDYNSTKLQFLVYAESVANASVSCNSNILILEGDWTNKPIPQYFEGMKSVGQDDVNGHKIEILSKNKNLLIPTRGGKHYCFIKKGTRLVLSEKNNTPSLGGNVMLSDINGNIQWFSIDAGVTTPRYITTNNDIYCIENALVTSSDLEYQVEIGTERTSYVSYALNKKEILLNEPLRGIPNGIKDTIEKVNGEWKIVRKVGSIVLNGSEPWKEQVDGSTEEFLDIRCGYPTLLNRNRQNGLCDKFNYITKGSPIGEQEGIQLYTHTTQSQFIASMSKSRFSTVDSFKEYLAQNHTTVLYELATPIIEDISPVTLQCWKNGTISIDEVLPVETTHTVALNKPAQIKRNIEELTVLRKRVQALEDFYDQVALEQSHQLSLINNSIELDYDI